MIAGDVDDARSLMRPAQKFLHHVIMPLRPVPTGPLEAPAVDHIADEIERFRLIGLKEVEKMTILARACAQMQIGNKDGGNSSPRIGLRSIVHASGRTQLRISLMTGVAEQAHPQALPQLAPALSQIAPA